MEQHTDTTVRLPRRVSDARYWLITREGRALAEVFIIDRRGGETVLPVFSSEEEAQIFTGTDCMEGCWHAQPIRAGDLVSVLYGPSTRIGYVALDPVWEMLTERVLDLVSLSRETFVVSLLGGDHYWFEGGSRGSPCRQRGDDGNRVAGPSPFPAAQRAVPG